MIVIFWIVILYKLSSTYDLQTNTTCIAINFLEPNEVTIGCFLKEYEITFLLSKKTKHIYFLYHLDHFHNYCL